MASQVVHTETRIARSADEVWAVIADVNAYAQWNPMYRFEGTRLEEGSAATLIITLGRFPAKIPVLVEEVVEGALFRWGSGNRFVGGSHFLRVEPISATESRLVHGETFRGLGLIWPLATRRIHAEYQKVADALRDRVESQGA